jgi:chemotaxis protein histidine kinase CheA
VASEALRLLRERFREATGSTVAGFEALAAQLADSPAAPESLEALCRELHRVRGTAGSYGFADASRLAGRLEERAIRWAADPGLDRDQRAALVLDFVAALRGAFER